MPQVVFVPVSNDELIGEVSALAKVIWREHFTEIIGAEQVEYMLKEFQNKKAVRSQIQNDNYSYFIIKVDDRSVGYFSYYLEQECMVLSKLYILSECRGKGIGRQCFEQIETDAKALRARKITLLVNKMNRSSIEVYNKMGYINEGPNLKYIGQGFFMDDYKMSKSLI